MLVRRAKLNIFKQFVKCLKIGSKKGHFRETEFELLKIAHKHLLQKTGLKTSRPQTARLGDK
jgi:hypothetical protein